MVEKDELEALARRRATRSRSRTSSTSTRSTRSTSSRRTTCSPDKNAAKPYRLLVEAMTELEQGRDRPGRDARQGGARRDPPDRRDAVRRDDALRRRGARGRPRADVDADGDRAERAASSTMARQLVEALAGDFDPEKYHDEYREQLLGAHRAEGRGRGDRRARRAEEPAKVLDLMAALEASLARTGAKQGSGATPAKKPAAKKAAGQEARGQEGGREERARRRRRSAPASRPDGPIRASRRLGDRDAAGRRRRERPGDHRDATTSASACSCSSQPQSQTMTSAAARKAVQGSNRTESARNTMASKRVASILSSRMLIAGSSWVAVVPPPDESQLCNSRGHCTSMARSRRGMTLMEEAGVDVRFLEPDGAEGFTRLVRRCYGDTYTRPGSTTPRPSPPGSAPAPSGRPWASPSTASWSPTSASCGAAPMTTSPSRARRSSIPSTAVGTSSRC